MLTPTEATRRIVDAATAKTDYTAALDRKLVLPFFRTYRIQPIVAAWMEFAVPELIRQKTASEADELAHMLKPVHLEGKDEKKYQEDTRMTKKSALYATADVFLTAFSLMHPIMLRFEELTVEDKGSETSRQKRLYEESAAFYRLCKAMNIVDDLVNPVLEGRYTFGYRESLESASALKERADDMLESLLRMRHNIENYEARKEEVEEQFRFSVAARVSAAIVVLEMMQKLELLLYRSALRALGKHWVQKHHIGREVQLAQTRHRVTLHQRHARGDSRELRIACCPLERVTQKGRNHRILLEHRNCEARRGQK